MVNFVEEAEKLIRIKSISQYGNEEMSLYLQELLKRMGIRAELQEVTHSLDGVSKRQFNVIGVVGDPLVDGQTKKGILLNTHTDTVSPGISKHWTKTEKDPFNATIADDRIFGLGAADVKLDFLCKLKAVERYQKRSLKMPIYLVGTAGEEIGMIGAKFLIKSKALNPKYVLVGQPSGLEVVYSHKAYAVYEVNIGYSQLVRDAKGFNTRIGLHCYGKAAHGSCPKVGDNAIHKMLSIVDRIKKANFNIKLSKIRGGDAVNKVPDLASIEFYITSDDFEDLKRFYRENLADEKIDVEFGGLGETGVRFLPDNVLDAIVGVSNSINELQQEMTPEKDDSFDPDSSTVNFGKIDIQSGAMGLLFDIRMLPGTSLEKIEKAVNQKISALNANFPNLIMKVVRKRYNPAFEMDKDNELVSAACESQRAVGFDQPRLQKSAVSTEAAQYFSSGFDSIVFGPGESKGNAHSANECNMIAHLDKAVHFYDRMIERFCL